MSRESVKVRVGREPQQPQKRCVHLYVHSVTAATYFLSSCPLVTLFMFNALSLTSLFQIMYRQIQSTHGQNLIYWFDSWFYKASLSNKDPRVDRMYSWWLRYKLIYISVVTNNYYCSNDTSILSLQLLKCILPIIVCLV